MATFEQVAAHIKGEERAVLAWAGRRIFWSPEIDHLRVFLGRMNARWLRVKRLRVPSDVYQAVKYCAMEGTEIPPGHVLRFRDTVIEQEG
jgi:hypothetical protein